MITNKCSILFRFEILFACSFNLNDKLSHKIWESMPRYINVMYTINFNIHIFECIYHHFHSGKKYCEYIKTKIRMKGPLRNMGIILTTIILNICRK